MPATIKDVAEKAGVSITTVSHVINKTRFVSEQLQQRVNIAIAELGYQPSHFGRGLRQGRSYTIGLLLPDPNDGFFQTVARGIEEHSQNHGFGITCCNTDEDPIKERFFISFMKQRSVDGLIIAPTTMAAESLSPLIHEGIPLVIIDRYIEDLPVDQVFSDNRTGSYQAAEHLLGLGHKRIGLLTGIRGITTTEHRLQGYRDCLQEHGIDVDESLIVEGRSKIEEGYAATEQLLLRADVTAVFSINTMMTLGALKCFKARGIDCPHDISLTGFDDPDWAAVFTPSLTVVAQQPYKMGYEAGELLFRAIEGQREEEQVQTIELKTQLIIRESTARSTGH